MIMRSNPHVFYTKGLFFNSISKSVLAWKSRTLQSVNWVHSDSACRYRLYRMSRIFTGDPDLMEQFKNYLYNSNFGKTQRRYSKTFPFKS
jgi:hypothetical protein